MDLSIVILHTNSPRDVSHALAAINKAILPTKTEILVVHNGQEGANDQVEIPAKSSFEIHFFQIPNRGYPQGNNFGLSHARGRYLCILNADVLVERRTFEVLLNYLKEHPQVGIVGPRLRYPDGTVQDNYRNFPRPMDLVIKRTFLRHFFKKRMRHYLMWDKDPELTEPVDWLTGAFQIFPRKVWEELKPKDERFFLFMSDVDLCRRAWEKGFQVYFIGDTEALHHSERLSSGGVFALFYKRTLRIHLVDAVKYFCKYLGRKIPKRAPGAYN